MLGTPIDLDNLLSANAPISPYVPLWTEALLGANLTNLRGGYALIVAVIPLANILGDFDPCSAGMTGFKKLLAVDLPRQGI